MVKRFITYSAEKRLFSHNSRILLAVSGGIDSMVMAHLFRLAGIEHGIAHCNFSLRADESDKDEEFVAEYAAANKISFHSIRFDTLTYASGRGISIQMAARELRYTWFEQVVRSENYDSVAVAHNLNDNVETFIINLLRGTGINGLTGMDPTSRGVIRPLLFLTREEIADFAAGEHIQFREDSSNAEVKYLRNKIRHHIIPQMEKAHPGVLTSVTGTMHNLKGSAEILDAYLDSLRSEIIRVTGDTMRAEVKSLARLTPLEPHLYELFRTYGLSPHQTDDLVSLLSSATGKRIATATHLLVKDREYILISPLDNDEIPSYKFTTLDEMRLSGLFSEISITLNDDEPLPSGALTACIDLDRLVFPLTVRRWEAGDRFIPLGMTHMKKVSDFLIDLKVALPVKQKIMLLISGGETVWVLGYRIDNRYRVTPATSKILLLTL